MCEHVLGGQFGGGSLLWFLPCFLRALFYCCVYHNVYSTAPLSLFCTSRLDSKGCGGVLVWRLWQANHSILFLIHTKILGIGRVDVWKYWRTGCELCVLKRQGRSVHMSEETGRGQSRCT
jgi:hypothetical protein